MSDAKLKPCPFCGGEAENKTEQLSEVYSYANQVTISCKSCGCSRVAMGDRSKRGYADNSTTEVRALSAWNNRHDDKLTSRVAELELSLDDRDCYIADADMKNEELVKRVAELEAALNDVLIEYQGLGGCKVLINQCNKALKESE